MADASRRRLCHLRAFPPGGRMSLSGTPCDHVFRAGSGPFGRSKVPRHVKQTKSPRHLARWRGVFVFGTLCTLPSANAFWSFWYEDESAGDAGGSSSGWESAIRAVRVDLHGIGQVIFLRHATKSRTGGATYNVGPLCVVLIYFDEMHLLRS